MQNLRIPRRGGIYLLNWSPARGSEQSGRRPGLIVSNDTGNRFSPTVVVAAVTSRPPRQPYPVTVRIPTGTETGLDRESIVLCARLITISKERLQRHMGALPTDLMHEVDDALRAALGLV